MSTPAEQLNMIESLVSSGLLGAEGLAALMDIDVARAREIVASADKRRELLEREEELRTERLNLRLYG